jgi:hypothetical protein
LIACSRKQAMVEILSGTEHLVRAADPDTSRHAASLQTDDKRTALQQEIERWALGQGPDGFTDWDLVRAFPMHAGSTVRTRRHELAEQGWLADSNRRRLASMEREQRRLAIIWVHRIYKDQANDNQTEPA